MNDDTLVSLGSAVKALGGNRIGGHAILFTTEDDPDLQGEYFTSKTDFWGATKAPLLFHHGLPETRPGVRNPLGKRRLAEASLKADEVGVWAEAELAASDAYEKKLLEWAKAGKLRFSTGSADHLRERKPGPSRKAMEITSWPIVEVSLTMTSVEPRAMVLPLKSLIVQPSGPPRLSQLRVRLAEIKATGRLPTGEERTKFQAYKSLLMDVVGDIDRIVSLSDRASGIDVNLKARLMLAELEAPFNGL